MYPCLKDIPCPNDREKFDVQIFLKSISPFIFVHLQIDKYLKQDFSTCALGNSAPTEVHGSLIVAFHVSSWKISLFLTVLLFIW